MKTGHLLKYSEYFSASIVAELFEVGNLGFFKLTTHFCYLREGVLFSGEQGKMADSTLKVA